MKKRIISLLVSATMFASFIPVSFAESGSIDSTGVNTEFTVDDLQNLDDDFLEDTFQEAVTILQSEETQAIGDSVISMLCKKIWNNHEYAFFHTNDEYSWNEAKQYCESLSGHLASITSQAEDDAIHTWLKTLGNGTYSAYLGACKADGVWQWITGEDFKYTNWHMGEPSEYNGDIPEYYLSYYGYFENSAWNDTDEYGAYGFICEWDEVIEQADDNNYIENLPIIKQERYTGNKGDSFIDTIIKENHPTIPYGNGNVDINGNVYQHGLEAWIARWNYRAEKSWASVTYELNNNFKSLVGDVVIIESYNTTNFDSTLYFYGDNNKLIESYHLTPDSLPLSVNIDVNNIKELTIKVEDNIAVNGGTSFGLVNFILSAYPFSDKINNSSNWSPNKIEDENTDSSIKNNSLGISTKSFNSFNTEKDTLHGPRIKILGKSFYLFDLPINMSLKTPLGSVKYNADKEKFEVMLGKLDKTALSNINEENKTYHELKEFINFCGKKTTRDTWNKYQHLRKVLKEEKMDLGFSFNATPAGYMEFDKNGKLLEGSIVYVLNMDMNMKQPIPAAPYIYIKVGLGVDATGKFGIKSIDTNAYSLFGSLGLDVAPYVGVGAGSSKFVGVEGGAKLKLATKLELIRNKKLSEIFSASMTGSLYLKLKALSFINFDKSWDIAKTSIYPNFGADLMSIELASYDDMVVMPRDYMDEESVFVANNNISLFGMDNIETSIFKTNIYPNAEPQLVKLNDGRELLVWLDNDASRNDINCSVLKYSINNGTTWSEPVDIYNNGTADFAPSVAITENGVALVWQKANVELADNASLTEMAKEIDLYYSEFDGTSWSTPIKLTDENTVYEFAPNIASDGTNITIAWVENSENDCFALSGTNTIYTKSNADNWTETTMVASDLSSVTSAGVTYMDGAAAIAYTVDTDGNVETSDDVELFEYYGGEITRVTEDEVIDYGLTMGDSGYSWIHNNQLWERNSTGVSLMEIPIMPLYLNNVHIMSNGKDRVIVWEQTNEFTSDLYAMYYDNENESWGEPVRLTEDNKKIRESSGYMTADGAIRMAFGQAEVDENLEDIYGKCNLMVSNITEKCDIKVTSANCEYTEYVPGEEATIWATVQNNSSSKISKFDVTVTSGGETIAQKQIEKEIISGGSDVIEIPYTLPSDLSSKIFTMTVTPTEKTDEDLTNNSARFEMGFADIKVDAVRNNNAIAATISNIGCLSAENVVCNLLSADGEVIDTKTIGAINAGTEQSIDFEFDGMNNISVSVSTDNEENLYSNNTVVISTSESTSKNKVYIVLGEYDITDNKLSVNATVSNETEENENVTVIVASYKDGMLEKVMTKPITLNSESTQVIPYDFGTSDADSVKIFVWNGLDGMKPYDGVGLVIE